MIDFNGKKGFICDMDGVIYHGNRVLPGVVEFIDWLQQEKKEYLFLTNTSGYTPRELQQKLLVLSRVSTRETISEFAFRPTLVLDGVGSSVEMARGQKS